MQAKRIGIVAFGAAILAGGCSLFLGVDDLAGHDDSDSSIRELDGGDAFEPDAPTEGDAMGSDDGRVEADAAVIDSETGPRRNPLVGFCTDAGQSIVCEDFDIDGGWASQWAVSGSPTTELVDGNHLLSALVEASATDVPQESIRQTLGTPIDSGDLHLAFKLRVVQVGGQRPDAATPSVIVAGTAVSHASGVQRDWRIVINPAGAGHRAVIEQKITAADGGNTFTSFAPAAISEPGVWEDVELIVRLRQNARDEIVLSVNGQSVSSFGDQPLTGYLLSLLRVGLPYVRPASTPWEVEIDNVRLWFELQ